MDPTLTALLIVILILLAGIITVFIASRFMEDVRLKLYARFVNPVLILAGKDHMVVEGMEREVYAMIRNTPGIGYRDLLEELNAGDTTLSFQLSRLLRENLITARTDDGKLSFTPNYITKQSPEAHDLPPISPLEQSILDGLRRLGPAARAEIETTMRVPTMKVNLALDMLKKRGLIGFDGEDKWSYCWAESNQPRLK